MVPAGLVGGVVHQFPGWPTFLEDRVEPAGLIPLSVFHIRVTGSVDGEERGLLVWHCQGNG